MRHKITLAAVIFFLYVNGLTAWDNLSLDLSLELATVSEAGPPKLYYRTLLFTYEQSKYARYVGIVFEFEQYQTIHAFKRNQKGIFVLPFEVPARQSTLIYRLVVDGLWMPDPYNRNQVHDRRGNPLSRLDITLPVEQIHTSPMVDAGGHAKFTVRHTTGKRVFLSGNFTNWEPFMIEMIEVSPGLYVFERTFPPGSYEYYFIVGGAKLLDPLNSHFGTDSHGYLASRFTVP